MTEIMFPTPLKDSADAPDPRLTPEALLERYRNNRWYYEEDTDLVLRLFNNLKSALITVLTHIIGLMIKRESSGLSKKEEAILKSQFTIRKELADAIEELGGDANTPILTLEFQCVDRRKIDAAERLEDNFHSIVQFLNDTSEPKCVIDEDALYDIIIEAVTPFPRFFSPSKIAEAIEKHRTLPQNESDARTAAVSAINAYLGIAAYGFDNVSYQQSQLLEKEIIYVLLANLCLESVTTSAKSDTSQDSFTFRPNPFGIMDVVAEKYSALPTRPFGY